MKKVINNINCKGKIVLMTITTFTVSNILNINHVFADTGLGTQFKNAGQSAQVEVITWITGIGILLAVGCGVAMLFGKSDFVKKYGTHFIGGVILIICAVQIVNWIVSIFGVR